ncbi:heterodisulfide reductase subunit A, partial [Escherichia coli]
KQATYVRSLYPEARITIFYIDNRTPGRLEDFYTQVAADDKIELIKGKAAKIEEDSATGDLLVTAEDVMSGKKTTVRAQLVVLATGIVPNTDA